MQTQNKSFIFSPTGPLWDALKTLLGDLQEDYSLNADVKNNIIDARLILKLAKKGRMASQIIDSVASVARNTDDVDYTIDMGKYGKISAKDFKLYRTVGITVLDNKIDQNYLFKRMCEWLSELITTKRVYAKV